MITCRFKIYLPFQSIFLKYAKSCVTGMQSPTSENIIKYNSKKWTDNFFHRDSLIMAKYFIFLGIFGDLDRVETGISEEGINSMKTLPKSS